jgi:hypothetical protein
MVFAFQSLISNSRRSRIGVLEGPAAAEAGKRPYMDRNGRKIETPLPAVAAVSSALGSPRSSLETDPVVKIAFMRSLTCVACSMTASESWYRS